MAAPLVIIAIAIVIVVTVSLYGSRTEQLTRKAIIELQNCIAEQIALRDQTRVAANQLNLKVDEVAVVDAAMRWHADPKSGRAALHAACVRRLRG